MIYLDHNATTPVAPEVLETMEPYWKGHFVNPSSASVAARPVKRAITVAREECAALLGCDPEELIFTSGGTEALNTALHSVTSQQPDRRHLIVGGTEHEAVLRPVAWLEQQGYAITRLPVDPGGMVRLADLAEAFRPGSTAAVCLMWANNETGVLHPVEEAAALAGAHGVPFITDAVQAAGKVPVNLHAAGAQYAAFSGHKFHAPKGIGLLYVQRNSSFQPLLLGGAQENRRRAGTENPALIAGIGAAARLAMQKLTGESNQSMRILQADFESAVLQRIPGSHLNGSPDHRVPNTSSLRFEGTQAEGLLLLLDQKGICASAGSACTTGSLEPSHVLTAMGLSPAEARSTLRFSFSRTTTAAELQQTVETLAWAVEKFRSLFP